MQSAQLTRRKNKHIVTNLPASLATWDAGQPGHAFRSRAVARRPQIVQGSCTLRYAPGLAQPCVAQHPDAQLAYQLSAKRSATARKAWTCSLNAGGRQRYQAMRALRSETVPLIDNADKSSPGSPS